MKKYLAFVLFVISMTGNVYAADIEGNLDTAIENYKTDVNIGDMPSEEIVANLSHYFAVNMNAGLISNDMQLFDTDDNGLFDGIKINYLHTDEKNKQFIKFVEKSEDAVISAVSDMQNKEKVKAVYKHFCQNFQYDTELHYDLQYLYRYHKGTCCSFTVAFKRIMDKCDIPCKIIVSEDGNHEWNAVFVDNKWREIDITDGIRLYNTGFPDAEMRAFLK